jgi:predicted nucleic acid-binding protein
MAAELTVYADATVLIALGRIDRLNLLALLPTPIYVTEWVWREVASNAEKPGVAALLRARAERLIAVVDEGDPSAFPELDPGESTVLTAAAAAHAAVLVDERKAREVIAVTPQLKEATQGTIGTIGLILLAKRRGRIAAVRPVLDDLIQQGFWVSPPLYRDALERAHED